MADTNHCPHCGAELQFEGQEYCWECGRSLGGDSGYTYEEETPATSTGASSLVSPLLAEEPLPQPIVEEPIPIVEEQSPVIEEPAPAPVVIEPEPVVEEPVPVVEEPAPVVEEPAPVVEEPVPEPIEEPAPVFEEPEPEPEPIPEPMAVAPEPEPEPQPKPAPIVEPARPVVEPTRPVVEPARPVVEPAKPVGMGMGMGMPAPKPAPKKSRLNPMLIVIPVVLLLVVGGALFFILSGDDEEKPQPVAEETEIVAEPEVAEEPEPPYFSADLETQGLHGAVRTLELIDDKGKSHVTTFDEQGRLTSIPSMKGKPYAIAYDKLPEGLVVGGAPVERDDQGRLLWLGKKTGCSGRQGFHYTYDDNGLLSYYEDTGECSGLIRHKVTEYTDDHLPAKVVSTFGDEDITGKIVTTYTYDDFDDHGNWREAVSARKITITDNWGLDDPQVQKTTLRARRVISYYEK